MQLARLREAETDGLPEEQSFMPSWKLHPDEQVGAGDSPSLHPPATSQLPASRQAAERGTRAGRVAWVVTRRAALTLTRSWDNPC